MNKKIYLYQNQNDLKEFIKFLSILNVDFCSFYGEYVQPENIQFCGNEIIYLLPRCMKVKTTEQWGRRFLAEECKLLELSISSPSLGNTVAFIDQNVVKELKDRALDVYRQIQNYIDKEYLLDDSKLNYIGRGFYKDWLSYDISVPFIIRREVLTPDPEHFIFYRFTAYLRGWEYIIAKEPCDYRIIGPDEPVDPKAESFIIYHPEHRQRFIIPRYNAEHRRAVFDGDSPCAHVYREKKNGKYEYKIVIDARLLDSKYPHIDRLFALIKGYLCVNPK